MSDYRPPVKLPPEVKHVRDTAPWHADREAQELVAAHPTGLTLEEVGAHFGVTRERIRQIEAQALRKLRAGASLSGWQRHAALHPGEPGEYAPPWG